jgi:hypothetical protein
MPTLRLSDGRVVNVRRVSDIQLVTDLNFSATRREPVIIEVAELEGRPNTPTRIVVGDHHSVWRSHQVERIPPSATAPATVTGLTSAEARAAALLFDELARWNADTDAVRNRMTQSSWHKPWVLYLLLPVVAGVLSGFVLWLLRMN